MGMYELPVVVYLPCKICVIFLGRLQYYLQRPSMSTLLPKTRPRYLGAIGEFVSRKIDLAKRSLPNEAAERVIANGAKVL